VRETGLSMNGTVTDSAFWRGRRVALTGASGFVGHHLALKLRERGADVRALVRDPGKAARLLDAGVSCGRGDLDDTAALAALADGCDFLFHLAGAVDFGDDWARFGRVNVQGTANVLRAASAARVRRFIHTSSVVAVGASDSPRTLTEQSDWNLGKYRVPYVTTKHQAEMLALAAPLDVVAVNPSCVVGPDDHFRSEFGTLLRRFWRGWLPIHFGGGNNFVDVRDVAAGMLLAAEKGKRGQRYLLTTVNRTWTDLFRDLARCAGRPIPRLRLPQFVADVAGQWQARFGQRKRALFTAGQARLAPLFFFYDSAKAQRQLGWQPRPWSETVTDTYRYWMAQDRRRHAA
jgi:dihydroflavonol-4-reductase